MNDELNATAEKQMASHFRGGGDLDVLVDCFQRGWPLDNLYRFLDSDAPGDIECGIYILQNIGKKAKPFVHALALIMNKGRLSHKYHGMEVLQSNADENDTFADWVLLSLVDFQMDENREESLEFQYLFSAKAIHCLSLVTFSQLRGAKKYLTENKIDSPHLYAIDYYLEYYGHKEMIRKFMKNEETLHKKYAVAMASQHFSRDPHLLELACEIDDATIREYLAKWHCRPKDDAMPENANFRVEFEKTLTKGVNGWT